MVNNAKVSPGAEEVPKYPPVIDMAAFDQLPLAFRRFLAEAPYGFFSVQALEIYQLGRSNGLSTAQIISRLKFPYQRLAQCTYGPSYPDVKPLGPAGGAEFIASFQTS